MCIPLFVGPTSWCKKIAPSDTMALLPARPRAARPKSSTKRANLALRGLGLRLCTGGWRNRRELNTTGKTIWLTGHLRSCQKIYDREVRAYMIALHSLATHHDYKKASADWVQRYLVEICRDFCGQGNGQDCTLASKACARDEAADRCCFRNLVLTELFYGEPAFRGEM